MIEMAAKIGVEHRFLSSFYLLYNPEVDGRHAQFLPGKDEVEFLRTNHTGMLLFKKAALALLDAAHDTRDPRHGGSSTSRAMARLPFESPREAFNEATEAFTKIVELNRALAQSLDQQEFRRMTEYFGTVDVRGRILRGVNAGDQPWSYIIDLLFGVDLKRVFEVAFARKYPPHIQNAAQALAYEFETSEAGYLRASYLLPEDYIALTETIQLVSTASAFILHPSSFILSPETVQVYLMTSNTHYGLAKKYVPIDPHTGTQIGSSGTNIDTFLKTLIEERRRALDKLTQVGERSSTSLIPHS
jgi:hypothetical protein